MKTRTASRCAFAAVLLAAACDSDHVEKNPTFIAGTGGTRARDGGREAAATASGGAVTDASAGAGGSGGGNDASSSAGGIPTDAGSSGGNPGTGGAPEQDAAPPYDCVLHPKTHVEIINACTDAVRVEKHPALPAVPMQ